MTHKRRDIVERLRIRQPLLGSLCDEAADEIERLRSRVDHLEEQIMEALGERHHWVERRRGVEAP